MRTVPGQTALPRKQHRVERSSSDTLVRKEGQGLKHWAWRSLESCPTASRTNQIHWGKHISEVKHFPTTPADLPLL